MKRILITNDDGIHAPALAVLKKLLAHYGEVIVSAPEVPMNAKSSAITLNEPVRINKVRLGEFSVTGTPVDSARIGVLELMDDKVDLVVSGINMGANLGDDINYSGTVAAAREAASLGVLSIASSLVTGRHQNFRQAADYTIKVVEQILDNGLPERTFLNLNVPDLPDGEVNGIRISRTGIRIYDRRIFRKKDPQGRDYYWLLGEKLDGCMAESTDFESIAKGYASLTALTMDYTEYSVNKELENWDLN
ncbi:5'/3'-nucleotidase SurE [Elusimicrobiota bacterium]